VVKQVIAVLCLYSCTEQEKKNMKNILKQMNSSYGFQIYNRTD